MTDIEQALAEALGEDSPLTRKAARDIIAHPSMQAIARVVDAAVEVSKAEYPERTDLFWAALDILDDAIAAALDQPQETQQSIVVGLVGDQMEDAT